MENNESSANGNPSFSGCCNGHHRESEISRRKFVKVTGTSVLGSVALTGLTWSALSAIQPRENTAISRKKLIVKPVFTYSLPVRREKTSWREWGGIQTENDAAQELAKIMGELESLQSKADFPVEFLPVSPVRREADLSGLNDSEKADLFLVYAAGGGMNIFDSLNKKGKNMVFFLRHKSGPVYLWYEIISPRYLRQHTDALKVSGMDETDVVVDSQDELMWRMRALCGLKNTLNTKIIAIGGAGGWSTPSAPEYARNKFRLDIIDVSYDDLGSLLKEAMSDNRVISRASSKADEYLGDKTVKLETRKEYVQNCFVLEEVLTRLMDKYECRAITINNCMSTIMPLSETTACLTLSLLNDAGYLAFCESDFVVVPSGILMANIAGKPVFLNDPTYPHDGLITLAHCTAPRRMDGKKLEPARILTHFESDYGAAPKVEMLKGQTVTNIIPDFEFKRNVGFVGKIEDNPFLAICRSQIDVSFTFDSNILAQRMPGFHWITCYGDYLRECDYAMKKFGIGFDILT